MFRIFNSIKEKTGLPEELISVITAAAGLLLWTVAGTLVCLLLMALAGNINLADAVSFGAMTGTIMTSFFIMTQIVKYYD